MPLFLKGAILMKNYPEFIEIQFHNKCNSNCLICPYKDMNYKYEKMKDSLFYKFVNELDFTRLKRIIPYLNNEPFLDSDFVNKVEYIRKKLPNVEIEISTNASVISDDAIKRLTKINLTELRLSVFGFSDITYKKMMPNLNKQIVFKNLEKISKEFTGSSTIISIVMIDNGDINEIEFSNMEELCKRLGFKFERWGFLDRSNNVKYKSNNIFNNNVNDCEQNRPIERMHILANGDVILCCQDWKHTIVIGNIEDNTIEEIWNSQKYNEIRNSLYDKSKDSPTICKYCKLGKSGE